MQFGAIKQIVLQSYRQYNTCSAFAVSRHPVKGRQVANVAKGLAAPLVPAVGDTVIGRVTRIQPRACIVDILCVGNSKLKTSFQGIIRIQDVRDFAGEQVLMSASFRPGDLVRAEAISLGTMREYVLSTKKPALGVIWAWSLEGAALEPLSWKEMRCPVSGQVEKRKVAVAPA